MSGLGQRRWVHLVASGAGIALSVALASSAFVHWHLVGGLHAEPRFSIAQLFRDLPKYAGFFVAFVALMAAVLPSRACQWQCALSRPVPWAERYHFIAIGAFVHNVLPGKLGDLSRAFLLARTQRMPFVRSLGSVIVCKLMEFAATMLLVGAALVVPRAYGSLPVSKGAWLSIVACVVFVGVVVMLAHYAAPAASALRRRGRLPKLVGFLDEVAEGLGTARSFRGMLMVLGWSLPGQLASALAFGIGLSAIGVPNGVLAGPLIIGALSLTQSVPGMPSDVGVYYFITAAVARALGASAEAAAAFALLTHVGTLVAQVGLGGISLAIRRIAWKDLRGSAQLAASEARRVTAA